MVGMRNRSKLCKTVVKIFLDERMKSAANKRLKAWITMKVDQSSREYFLESGETKVHY
jgi:hypothetical protein